MITDKQKLERRLGIGGSDMPIILGLSNYMTPYELYLEKIGLGETKEVSEYQYWGNKLEGVVREEFKERNQIGVEEIDTMVHPIFPYLRANVDGFIPDWNAILEIKCSASWMADKWGDEETDAIPMEYLVQVAHYCAVKNADFAYIAVLIGGNKYKQFKYTRDLEIENKLIDHAKRFWACVESRTPPPPVNIDDLKKLFPVPEEKKKVIVSGDISTNLVKLVDVRSKIKEYSDIEEQCKFDIMAYMQDAEYLTDPEGKEVISWKANKRGSRTFLIKGI